MTFDEAAMPVAARVRASGCGFLTMRREELREAFGIGKFTERQATEVCEALGRQGIFVHPHPYESGPTLRLYDQKHPVGAIAETVARPDELPETSLRRTAEVFARETAGRDLRSDDAPWLVVFELFLHLVLGREPDDWEDLRDDRHPSELARELALALGFAQSIAEAHSTLRIAAAIGAFRPRRRPWLAKELTGPDGADVTLLAFVDGLAAANRRLREEHERLLRQAARLLLRADAIPDKPVELGLIGLRYRREDAERSSGA